MIKLLKFEWRKLWRQKSLYICFGVGLLIAALFIILGKVLENRFGVEFGTATGSLLGMLPKSGFMSLLGIYLALFVCSDFSQHTIKNIYARGYSRTAVYAAKYLISLGVALAMALLYLVFSFFFTLILGAPLGSLTGEQWAALVLQLWILVGIHALYFGIAMMIGKTGGSVAINVIGISLVFSIIGLLISILDIDFDIDAYNIESLFQFVTGLQIDTSAMPVVNLETDLVVRSLVMPIVYVAVFVGGGWFVNRRREV